ncbi:MAG: TetR/AcrR family transcriptional regulator [Sandaracinaceae bacterium]
MSKTRRASSAPVPAGRRSQKRDAILVAAKALFLEHGYAGTSMDAVTERAAVSKPTVYRYFASKQELFRAVMESLGAMLGGILDELDVDALSLEEALSALAEPVLTIMLSEKGLAFFRILVEARPIDSQVARSYHEQVEAPILRAFTAVLRAHGRSDADAVRLLDGLRAPVLPLLVGSREPPREAEVAAMARDAVRAIGPLDPGLRAARRSPIGDATRKS